jgi:chromosome partitioning protein
VPIIVFAGQKGGAGKSTLALNLAVEGVRAGQTVTVVDLDPQQTCMKWGDRREGEAPAVMSIQAERLDKVLPTLTSDLIIVDTAGKADRELLLASRRADMVILPARPTVSDIETLEAASHILGIAKATNVWVVFNAANSTRDTRVAQCSELVVDMGMRVAPVLMCHRVLYPDAMLAGQGVTEADPASKVADEVRAFYTWVMEASRGEEA